jgi:hypothetical protein
MEKSVDADRMRKIAAEIRAAPVAFNGHPDLIGNTVGLLCGELLDLGVFDSPEYSALRAWIKRNRAVFPADKQASVWRCVAQHFCPDLCRQVGPVSILVKACPPVAAAIEQAADRLSAGKALDETGSALEGVASRDRWFVEQYEAIGTDTYHKPAKIWQKWCSMKSSERAGICPAAPNTVTKSAVEKAIKRALASRRA